jgi:hypothetical protein
MPHIKKVIFIKIKRSAGETEKHHRLDVVDQKLKKKLRLVGNKH